MRALANQVQMGSIDLTQNVEEMTILCRKLLRSDASDELLLDAVVMLIGAIDDKHSLDRPPPD